MWYISEVEKSNKNLSTIFRPWYLDIINRSYGCFLFLATTRTCSLSSPEIIMEGVPPVLDFCKKGDLDSLTSLSPEQWGLCGTGEDAMR